MTPKRQMSTAHDRSTASTVLYSKTYLQGQLSVLQDGKTVATRVPQAFLGEIALLYNCERTATVQCGKEVSSVLTLRERYSSSSLWLSSLGNFGRSTVLQAIRGPLLGISAFSLFVAVVHIACMRQAFIVPWPDAVGACIARGGVKMHTLLGGALSLLLVFRTNTAYGRFSMQSAIFLKYPSTCGLNNIQHYNIIQISLETYFSKNSCCNSVAPLASIKIIFF